MHHDVAEIGAVDHKIGVESAILHGDAVEERIVGAGLKEDRRDRKSNAGGRGDEAVAIITKLPPRDRDACGSKPMREPV